MHMKVSRRDHIGNFVLALALITGAAASRAEAVQLQPKRVFEQLGELKLPAAVVVAPDGSGRQFLVQQGGKILILPADSGSGEAKTFLDISDRKLIANAFEEGLLGLAFHPKFKDNGKFYIYHTIQGPKRTRVVEFKTDAADRDRVDAESERVLLEIPQPFWNHNSGNLVFGPDGFLYIGVGDGGKGDDPLQFGQNRFVLNGSILRIDVDKRDGDLEYGIPGDNPFVGKDGCREEIYCYGMRNPWGLSFDSAGHLWCADVGQGKWEEIDIIVNGGNYGWSIREGNEPFERSQGKAAQDAEFIDPIHQYAHTDGLSITGGFVYAGNRIPELKGAYIYGDWASGNLWALRYDFDKKEVISNQVLFARGKQSIKFQPSVITAAPDGEIQVSSWSGQIYVMEVAD